MLDTGRASNYIPLAMAQKKSDPNSKLIAENRRARHNYAVEDTLEVGVMLEGSEVKSMRLGNTNIAESYADVEDGELWLINSYVAPYEQAKTFGHAERRKRKLLASKREVSKLWQGIGRDWPKVKRWPTSVKQKKSAIGSAKKHVFYETAASKSQVSNA